MKVTQDILKQEVDYSPATGVFTRVSTGKQLQTTDSSGYIQIFVLGKLRLAHRMAWLYQYGDHPSGSVEHIDRNRQNNAIANLRLATHQQNMGNQKQPVGLSGLVGARRKGNKFESRVSYQGVSRYLGVFDTPEAASEAYKSEHKRLHGDYSPY